MPDLADLCISQVQIQDHQGLEEAKMLWMKSWESEGQEPSKEGEVFCNDISTGPNFYPSSLLSTGNPNRKSEGTSGLCGKELNLILK